MQLAEPLLTSPEAGDRQMRKQWAAEDFALSIGLLRECPYHGQPFQARSRITNLPHLVDPLDPNVRVFEGNTRELMAAVDRVTRDYGERCAFCAASDDEETFD